MTIFIIFLYSKKIRKIGIFESCETSLRHKLYFFLYLLCKTTKTINNLINAFGKLNFYRQQLHLIL